MTNMTRAPLRCSAQRPSSSSITAPLTNFFIILTKETAILSVVTVPELLFETQTMAAETFTYVEPFLALSLFYWFMVEVTSWLGKRVERHVTRHLRRA